MNFWKTCTAIVALATVCSALNACTPTKSETYSSLIQIKGDPKAFINGTTGDTTSGIPKSLFEDETVEYSMTIGGFVEEPREVMEDVLASQQPTVSLDGQKILDRIRAGFRLRAHNSKPKHFFLQTDSDIELPRLLFKEQNDSLQFVGLYSSNNGKYSNSKVEHYSVKKTKDAFSLLVSGSKAFGRYLYNFTFSRIEDREILKSSLDTAYNYLFGQGVKMARDQSQPLHMEICGNGRQTLSLWTESAISLWAPPLSDRLDITTEVVDTCPPFSDLNRSTVNFVEGWIEVSGPSGTLGLAVTYPNYFKDEIIDSDLFFIVDEWEEGLTLAGIPNFKMNEEQVVIHQEKFKEKYIMAVTHEMGHTLGLAHIGDSFGTDTESIMSYDLTTNGLQAYDIKAIQELYPIRKVEVEAPDLATGEEGFQF